jgi:hypothetical protein
MTSKQRDLVVGWTGALVFSLLCWAGVFFGIRYLLGI